MPLSNAQRQKRWRDKRNALAKRAEKMIKGEAGPSSSLRNPRPDEISRLKERLRIVTRERDEAMRRLLELQSEIDEERRLGSGGARKRSETRYVIVAKSAQDTSFKYFTGNGFKANLMLATRFRTEADAHRRCEKSVYCRRLKEAGMEIRVRGV